MLQWIAALEKVAKQSHYTGKNRFDSFAPIRLNVAAQWLVDGVGSGTVSSVALTDTANSATISGTFLGRSCWQRSPFIYMIGGYRPVRTVLRCADCEQSLTVGAELQLRRPGMDKYRLDRLLERKAKEGVKIYVIL